MTKKQNANGNSPVTVSELKKILKPILDKLTKHDKRFEQIDKNFLVINGKLAAFVSINTLNIDRAINALEERLNKRFDKIMTTMDAFIKRSETNEREIMFLGKQHDDLAKYCTQKIAYPPYGRV